MISGDGVQRARFERSRGQGARRDARKRQSTHGEHVVRAGITGLDEEDRGRRHPRAERKEQDDAEDAMNATNVHMANDMWLRGHPE